MLVKINRRLTGTMQTIGVLLLIFQAQANSQIVRTVEINSKLRSIVQLNLGSTTVGDMLKELSKQTGVVIKASNYLEEHRLYIAMNGITAAQALSSISEMHHWRWIENDKGEIVLTHKPILKPLDISEFAKAFRETFPVAWGPFIGENLNYDRVLTPYEKQMISEQKLERDANLVAEETSNTPAFINEMVEENSPENEAKSLAIFEMARRFRNSSGEKPFYINLFPKYKREMSSIAGMPYNNWTAEERKSVLKFAYAKLFSAVMFFDFSTNELFKKKMNLLYTHPEYSSISIFKKRLDSEQHWEEGDAKSSAMFSLGLEPIEVYDIQ